MVEVPFSIMSVQSEVPSKDDPIVTRGSQVTKLVTMDYMEGGVPVDFEKGKSFIERYKLWANTKDKETASPLYKEIKHNEKLLKSLIDIGYVNILDKLGIEETYNKEKKQS